MNSEGVQRIVEAEALDAVKRWGCDPAVALGPVNRHRVASRRHSIR